MLKFLPFLSGWKAYAVLIPSLFLVLSASGWYLHSAGHQKGYEKAQLECAADREAGKDEVLNELLRLQTEELAVAKENAALNRSIDAEVRKEDEVRENRIETIIRETPVVIRDNCRRDYSYVELRNELARAGFTSSDSLRGGSDNSTSGVELGVSEDASNAEPE